MEQQPFWNALRGVLAACKLRYYYSMGNHNAIYLVSDPLGTRAAAQFQEATTGSDLARITALECRTEQHGWMNLVKGESTASRPLKVSCEVELDPRLSGMPYSDSVRIDEALDEKGRSLRTVGAQYHNSSPETAALKFAQTMVVQGREGSGRIARLRGAVRLDVATGREIWKIPDPLKEKQWTRTVKVRNGAQAYEQIYTLNDLSLNDKEFRFSLHLAVQPVSAATVNNTRGMLHWFQYHTRVRHGDGQIWPFFHFQMVDNPGGSHLTLVFPRNLAGADLTDPAKLELELDLPSEIQLVDVPFDFKDLPIP